MNNEGLSLLFDCLNLKLSELFNFQHKGKHQASDQLSIFHHSFIIILYLFCKQRINHRLFSNPSMLIYSSPKAYLPLIPVSVFCLLSSFQAIHTISLLILCTIYSVGIWQQGYYNMATSLLMILICLGLNVEEVYTVILKELTFSFLVSLKGVLSSVKIYFLFFEAVSLIIAMCEAAKKYKKFRYETMNPSPANNFWP